MKNILLVPFIGAALLIAALTTALPVVQGELFAGSGVCAACHRDTIDTTGADVSIDRLWRSSMMANAARDPYWQATVRREGLVHPDYKDVIEDKCVRCHMPMGYITAAYTGSDPLTYVPILDGGLVDPGHTLHPLAIDAVSCTLCHQIEDDNFDLRESFSGGYQVNLLLPAGQRRGYGPYLPPRGLISVMQSASGFIPTYGLHMQDSALCATCHVLYTPYLDDSGQIAGEFAEQAVYLEWEHSAYPALGLSCQKCHMPLADGSVRLSITGGPWRGQFNQHEFVGGNAYVPRILRDFGEELNVTAEASHFDTTIASTTGLIQNQTAEVVLQSLSVTNGRLVADIEVRNLGGHKLPSGYPARRAWLHFVVRDPSGRVIFESGEFSPDGRIADNDNDLDPGRYEPHYSSINAPDQVQIYETIIYDTSGRLTTTLLKASAFAKDNRLLPTGFEKTTAPSDIAVYGAAANDANFKGGGDRITYLVDVGQQRGTFTVEVALLYQSIAYRWAQNLRSHSAEEIDRFNRYYDATPNLPLVAARAVGTVRR